MSNQDPQQHNPRISDTRSDTRLSQTILLASIVWGGPALLAFWSANTLFLFVWPWLLSGPLYALATHRLSEPLPAHRIAFSLITCGIVGAVIATHWAIIIPNSPSGGRLHSWLGIVTLLGSATVLGLEGVAIATKKRLYLSLAEAVLIVLFLGPALPWVGEPP